MITASKINFSLNELKILRPEVTKNLRICLRSFVNFRLGMWKICLEESRRICGSAEHVVNGNVRNLLPIKRKKNSGGRLTSNLLNVLTISWSFSAELGNPAP